MPVSVRRGGLSAFGALRYIPSMSTVGPTYQVSIIEKQPSGQNLIRILLRTEDREAANALVGSLEQDGQRCKLEILPPKKR